MVAPADETLIPGGILPTVGLFGGGGLFGGSDPYGAPPTAVQMNASSMNASSGGPIPIVGSPIFQGGPVSNSLQNWNPLFPRFRNRIDSRLYLRAEYLLWNVSGMNSPALVTTSPTGTQRKFAGVLGQPGTSVLFGDTELNDGTGGGVLLSGGMWVSTERRAAIEIEWFRLADGTDSYSGASDGSVILGRPFFDIVNGQETARLVSFPTVVGGDIQVTTASKMESFLINGRFPICPTHGACCQQCGMEDRTDWILGYRSLRLRDSLTVNENLVSQLSNAPGTAQVTDQFQTTNQFRGLQLGVIHRSALKRGWVDSSLRVALGNNEQSLGIGGNTTYTESGVVDPYSGGLLALRTNIGNWNRDEFVMVPEAGIRLGLRLTNRWQASLGYSLLYFPNVIRASEQIDTDLNPGLIPEEVVPLTGALRPRVLWVQSDYLAHGLHFGSEFQF
jgi:hypothetical protein